MPGPTPRTIRRNSRGKPSSSTALRARRSLSQRWLRNSGYPASESLRRWIRQHEIDGGEREGLLTDDREELSKLGRENRILLKQEKEVLRKAAVFFAREDGIR